MKTQVPLNAMLLCRQTSISNIDFHVIVYLAISELQRCPELKRMAKSPLPGDLTSRASGFGSAWNNETRAYTVPRGIRDGFAIPILQDSCLS